MRQRQRCIPQATGHPDFIAGLRTAAAQRLLRRHLAEDGHAQIERPARGVATDQLHAMLLRQREKTRTELRQPRFIRLGQRNRQHSPARRGAHRRHVRQIHRQRLVPEQERVGIGQKMRAAYQHVRGHREHVALTRLQQRGVVAHAEQRAGRSAGEIAADQVEFGHGL